MKNPIIKWFVKIGILEQLVFFSFKISTISSS